MTLTSVAIHFTRPRMLSVCRGLLAGECVCARACLCACGACDSTKMLGYHALMCMSNPLVLSHNPPVWWLSHFSSDRKAERRSVYIVFTLVVLVLLPFNWWLKKGFQRCIISKWPHSRCLLALWSSILGLLLFHNSIEGDKAKGEQQCLCL